VRLTCFLASIFSHLTALHLDSVEVRDQQITLAFSSRRCVARCPECQCHSRWIHRRTNHALREVWRRYASRLQPFFLPAYAPHLNLSERFWRYVKQKLACHRWWNDLDHLLQATGIVLANLEVHFHADLSTNPQLLRFRLGSVRRITS
jgi:hypothetical protein